MLFAKLLLAGFECFLALVAADRNTSEPSHNTLAASCTWTTWSEPVYTHGPTSTAFLVTKYVSKLYNCHGCPYVRAWPLGHAFLPVTFLATVTATNPTTIITAACSPSPASMTTVPCLNAACVHTNQVATNASSSSHDIGTEYSVERNNLMSVLTTSAKDPPPFTSNTIDSDFPTGTFTTSVGEFPPFTFEVTDSDFPSGTLTTSVKEFPPWTKNTTGGGIHITPHPVPSQPITTAGIYTSKEGCHSGNVHSSKPPWVSSTTNNFNYGYGDGDPWSEDGNADLSSTYDFEHSTIDPGSRTTTYASSLWEPAITDSANEPMLATAKKA